MRNLDYYYFYFATNEKSVYVYMNIVRRNVINACSNVRAIFYVFSKQINNDFVLQFHFIFCYLLHSIK